MADEDTQPRDWGHHKSPLFKLPPEIRNKIYRETFVGSQRELVHDPPLDVRVVPVTGRRSILSTVDSTHQFLLTCFQVYSEALAIYWSLTVVGNGCEEQFWRRFQPFSRGYFLNRIPAIARQHVQHLRRLELPNRLPNKWLQGDAIPRHLTAAQSLDFFPNLKSCSVLWNSYTTPMRTEVVARHPHVHILGRLELSRLRNALPQLHLNAIEYWSRITIEDHTSGKSLTWDQPMSADQWVSDEAAFTMVVDADTIEIEITERRLEMKALAHTNQLVSWIN